MSTEAIKAEAPALTAAATAIRSVASACDQNASVVQNLHSGTLADTADLAAAWSRLVDQHVAFLTAFAANATAMHAALVKAGVIYRTTDTTIGRAAAGNPTGSH